MIVKKRILIGGSIEICGLINQLWKVYTAYGHQVTRLGQQSTSNDWYNSSFDIRQRFFFTDVFRRTFFGNLLPKIFFSSHRVNKLFKYFFSNKKLVRAIFKWIILPKTDVYIHVWDFNFYDRELFFKDLKSHKVEFRLIIVGSDFMDWPLFFRHFHPQLPYRDAYDAMQSLIKPETLKFSDKMVLYEKYADVIFSAPTLSMHSRAKPYYNYILPIDVSAIKFQIKFNGKLKILHTPSIPKAKGTDYITHVIDKLKAKLDNFEFEFITNLPQSKLFEKLSDADILIDQIFAPGPASLSHEAAAAGCIVMTFSDLLLRGQEEQLGGNYICVDLKNLEEKLHQLLLLYQTDPDNFRALYIPMVTQARDFVVEHNSLEKAALRFIDLPKNGQFDFYPNPLGQKGITK